MARAIEASLKTMQAPKKLLFEASEIASHRTPDGGLILERKTLNQIHSFFKDSIEEFQCPQAMCGMIMSANAIVLATEILRGVSRTKVWTDAEIEEKIVRPLQNDTRILAETREVMRFVRDARRRYVESHADDFEDEKARRRYMRDWVANYEVSDYFIRLFASTRMRASSSVHFLRFNQIPERYKATHEELERMTEELPFGKTADETHFSRFIVETYRPKRALLRPEVWKKGRASADDVPTLLLDLNGHFCVGIPLRVRTEDRTRSTLLLLNTTKGSYCNTRTALFAYGLFYGDAGR